MEQDKEISEAVSEEETVTEAAVESEELADSGEDVVEHSAEKLHLLLEDARAKADEHWEMVIRARAESENLKKRHARELENAHKFAIEKFVNELLPVRDSMELGLSAAQDEAADVAKLVEGTELTLKLKPIPDCLAIVVCRPTDLAQAEQLLAALVVSETTPAAVELLAGPAWNASPHLAGVVPATNGLFLAVALEASESEVTWMKHQLGTEWHQLGVHAHQVVEGPAAHELLACMTEFPSGHDAPLTLQASMSMPGF